MGVRRIIQEAGGLTHGGVRFARGISHATAGSRLTPYVEETIDRHFGEISRVRGAVDVRLGQLGVTGEVRGLLYLAADMATTAAVATGLTDSDRDELRLLWDDLIAR